MAGTTVGGNKAKAKNLARDPNFYKRVGAIGGKLSRGGGFSGNPAAARIAGSLGGRLSTRGKKRTAKELAKIRKEYAVTYKHLLKVHEEANQ